MKRHLSTAIELVGLLLVAAAVALFDWRAGLGVFGAVLLFVGYALDRPGAGG